jgi:hypothetical protein
MHRFLHKPLRPHAPHLFGEQDPSLAATAQDGRLSRGGFPREHGEVVACNSARGSVEGRQDLACNSMGRGGVIWRVDGQRGAREVTSLSATRVAPTDSLEAERQEKLYHKVMFLYYQLASPEEQI